MQFVELGSFDVAHHHLAWPWIAVDPGRTWFAFAEGAGTIATRLLADEALLDGPTFVLPKDLHLPSNKPAAEGHRGAEVGVHGFAIGPSGEKLAVTGMVAGESVLTTLGTDGEVRRSLVSALAGSHFVAHAVTFDRSGKRLWFSAENGTGTALVLVDAESHEVMGVVTSAAFPPPASHELWVHPQDDAVLLLAACGQDGTFARVAGFTDGPPISIATAMDSGTVPAGFVGFSSDGARVHLAEADELRTHAWPGLEELSSVNLADDFVSSYAGVVLGHRIFVDGEDVDTGDVDAVMQFDRSATRGSLLKPPVPTGMWVGRIGPSSILTVEARGEPARGRVIHLPEPTN